MRWTRRGSAPCRRAHPGVLFMELKGWWSDAEEHRRKNRPRYHNEAGTITITEKKIHYKSM